MNYKDFLKKLRKEILSKDFEKNLKDFIEIDKKYYKKFIDVDSLLSILEEYENKDTNNVNISNCQVLTIGNPEIVFRLGIELIRNGLNEMFISIDDFCLAQDKFIVSIFNKIYKENKLKSKLIIDNLTESKQILENGNKYDLTLSISDSYRFDFYENDIKNIRFYPYSIIEVYSDDFEFESVKQKIFKYSSLNGFELVNIDEGMSFEDAIDLINNTGYGFAALLLSKDKEKQKTFREKVKSQNVIINENPFRKIKFDLDL